MLYTTELERLKPTLIAQIDQMAEARERRKDENEYRERRKNVEVLYDELKQSGADNVPLPPLPDFRKLPMVQRIQYKPGNAPSAAVAKELRSSKLATQLVVEEIEQWRKDARGALGAVLGFDAWEPERAGELHPVDRLSARFRCKKCDDKGRLKGWENISLDFSGTCRHRCKVTKRERAKETWRAENFVPDHTVRYLELSRIYATGSCSCLSDNRPSRSSNDFLRGWSALPTTSGPLRRWRALVPGSSVSLATRTSGWTFPLS